MKRVIIKKVPIIKGTTLAIEAQCQHPNTRLHLALGSTRATSDTASTALRPQFNASYNGPSTTSTPQHINTPTH